MRRGKCAYSPFSFFYRVHFPLLIRIIDKYLDRIIVLQKTFKYIKLYGTVAVGLGFRRCGLYSYIFIDSEKGKCSTYLLMDPANEGLVYSWCSQYIVIIVISSILLVITFPLMSC